MKKLFLVPLMALMTCVSVYAVEVNDLAGLQSALATGGEITLTADINAGTTQLAITKGVSIKGNGYCVKGTGVYVFVITTTDAVKMENIVIYAAKTNKKGRGIVMGDSNGKVNYNNLNVSLNNVTINATYRGIDMWYGDGQNLVVENCIFQNVQGQTVDAQGNPTSAKYDIELTGTNAGDTRGINFGQLTNSTITITNSTMQGFFYVLNNITGTDGNMTGSKLTATNSTFKGRAALNVWGYGAEYEFTDCSVVGINNYGGSQEGFSCFVFNNQSTCHDNTLTINGGTTVAAVFDETGSANPNANQFLVDDRATNNTIVINNSSYTCTKDLGVQKGGVIYGTGTGSSVTINGGTYDCPEIIDHATAGSNVVINQGEFDVTITTATAYYPEGYDSYFEATTSAIEVNGGTFINEAGEDINALAYAADPTVDPVSIVTTPNETYENQDGSTTVVPVGTNDATEQVDPAIKTDLVWGTDVDLTAQNVKLLPTQTLTLNSGVASANKLDLGQNTKVIIKDGAKLTIGEGGVALNNNGAQAPQIIVEAGGVAIVKGQMYGSVVENLLIQTSETKHGVLLFDPDMNTYGDNHPKGTVEFITKSYYVGGSDYQFERFGIPTWTTIESIDCDVEGLVTTLYVLGNSGWQNLGDLVKGTPFANIAQLNKPFATYNLLARQATPGATYKIAGALSGNGNAELYANLKWNSFANSYTADVNVGKLLEGLEGASDIDATVYVLSPAGNHTYVPDAIDAVWAASTKIAPMQTFLLNNVGGNNEYTSINYKNAVWSPATASAPARRKQEHDLTAKLRINVMNEQGVWDNLRMSESMTNIHNAEKYMGEDINLYAYDGDDKLAIVAAEDLNGAYIGFSTVNGGKFTLSFANVEGREFDLIDLEENVTVSVVEGNTYTFSAAKNTNADYRFKLVESKRVVTDVDKITAEKNVKGIYTIMGQYVGEMNIWNNLPAGIYVVNGEKRVK